MRNRIITYIIFIAICMPSILFGKTVELFNSDGTQNIKSYEKNFPSSRSPKYEQDSIKQGDSFKMPDGREFKVEKKLSSSGSNSYVFKVIQTKPSSEITGQAVALKIPISTEKQKLNALSNYVEVMQRLKSEGIRVPEIIRTPISKNIPYVAMELIENPIHLISAIRTAATKGKESLEYKGLIKLAKETAKFTTVMDLNTEQVIYDNARQEYVLMDAQNFIRKYSGSPLIEEEQNIFIGENTILSNGKSQYRPQSGQEEELIDDIKKTISNERSKIRNSSWENIKHLKAVMENPPPGMSFNEYYDVLKSLVEYKQLPSIDQIPHLFHFQVKPTPEQFYNLLPFKSGGIPSPANLSAIYHKIPKDEKFQQYYSLILEKIDERAQILGSSKNIERQQKAKKLIAAKELIIASLEKHKAEITSLPNGKKLMRQIAPPTWYNRCLAMILNNF